MAEERITASIQHLEAGSKKKLRKPTPIRDRPHLVTWGKNLAEGAEAQATIQGIMVNVCKTNRADSTILAGISVTVNP